MIRARWSAALFALAVFSLALPSTGCNKADNERLGKLGGVLRQKSEKLIAGNNKVIRGWQTVPLHLGEVAVDARVSARLSWDRALEDTEIQVQLTEGVVELTGQVRNPEQQRRAVELAQSTLGVEKVNDRLEIAPAKAETRN